MDRCNAFLQRIKESDSTNDIKDSNIEIISPDQTSVIEMNLHLGIFDVLDKKDQEIRYKESASDCSSDLSSGSDLGSESDLASQDYSTDSEDSQDKCKVMIQEI